MTQQKSVVATAEPLVALDGTRLEQFLELQQALLTMSADADLPEQLAQRISLFLGMPAAIGVVEEGRYRLSGRARDDDPCLDGTPLGEALTSGRPTVLASPARGDTTLVLPFGGDGDRPRGALHLVVPPRAALADETLALARALAGLAGLALASASHGHRLARIARLKSDSLSAMAHDLRAPLHALVGYTHLLGEGAFGPLTDEQREITGILERQALELVDLLGATLDVARLETGQLPLRLEEFGLEELVAGLRAGTFARPSRDGVLRWHFADGLPPLRSDRVKVKEIVQNLVGNALKHRDGAPVEVEVARTPREGGVRITVRDRGRGIDPAVLPHLFEPFRAGDSHGTGFGLYIVRCFVEALGGRATACSEPGAGTAVTVELPLAAPLR